MSRSRAGRLLTTGLAVLVSVAVVGAAAAFGMSWLLGADGEEEPPADAGATRQRLVEETAEGRFTVELSGPELAALVRENVAQTPARMERLAVDVDAAPVPDRAMLSFDGRLAANGLPVSAQVELRLASERLEATLASVRVAGLPLTGTLRDTLEEMIGEAVDLGAALGGVGLSFDGLGVRSGALVLSGATSGSSAELIDRLGAPAGAVGSAILVEHYGPGRLSVLEEPGGRVHLALGDSLAAATGMADRRQGYASRLHRQLELIDGVPRGHANLAVPGETSTSFIERGQLAAAVQVAADRDVELITLSIGANDLLRLLADSACAEDVTAPACAERIDRAIEDYRSNLRDISGQLRAAAPGAPLVLLTVYNPFDLGKQTAFERVSADAVRRLNAVARQEAQRAGAIVADGFAAFDGRVGQATLMLDDDPDVHPSSLGHDLLAGAVLEALRESRP